MIGLPRFSLSVALTGLVAPEALREQVEWAAGLGFRALQINAASPGTRARDLSRSARRDIAAMLRRHEMTCAGVDLFIPPGHFVEPAHADRAAEAAGEALGLAADLASLTAGRAAVCVSLPAEPTAAGIVAALVTRARECGAVLADASWPAKWTAQGVAACIDPATIMLAGDDKESPAKALARTGPAAACVRLSDLGPGGRVEPGTGRLDLLAYLVAASVVEPTAGPPVADLRGVAEQDRVARSMIASCGVPRLTA